LATSLIHSKIIAQAAKETLSPLGVFQKGRSRTWIDDRGWWIVVIEFQPSSWSRGSYLNVGAMWLWHEKDYFSFDFGSRIARFVRYSDERQFTPEAMKLAAQAREETIKLRRQFASVSDAARYLPKRARKHGNPWTELAAAIALGYVGTPSQSRSFFESIERIKPTYEWETRLRETARAFAEILDNPINFRRSVEETIWRTRKLLKLPERTELCL
jgi:hypothetical protein